MAGETVVHRIREIHRAERKKSAAARPGTHSIKIEDPLGSNNVKYNTWFYGRKVSGDDFRWCAAYQAWVAAHGGISDIMPTGLANVPGWRDYFKERGRLFSKPMVGDLVIFIFSATERHIGFVETVASDGSFMSIEGNVGSRVMRVKHRQGDPGIVGYGRPDYAKVEEDDMPDEKTFKKWVREVVDKELDRRLEGGVTFGHTNIGGTLAGLDQQLKQIKEKIDQLS
jgi:hypothetical protein